ncbi:MAG: hypothetical protein GXO25_02205, partial [Euryarchaeota archaeon]|nr:hypothetical protein [Euryarchaeota archaeon]
MKLLTALIMLLMMALYFSPFSHAQVMEQGWGQYGHDARHTWRTVHKINITKPAVLSKISADGRGMLLYENYLVVYHLYNVTVLDAETLTKFAGFSVGDYINAIGVYDGAVYVSGDKGLYAYTLNGKLIWKVANVSGKVIQISEDGIFLTNFVKVFRITFSGELKNTWLIGNISAPPAISGDMLYIPTWRLHNGNKLNTSLYVINLTENTTRVISIFGSFEIIENVAVDNDGTVYLYTELSNRSTGAGGIKIYALD